MTSKEMLGQLMAEHYKSAQRAKSEGRLVAWATSISPQELLETMDITVVYPENHAAAIGARKCAPPLISYAESIPRTFALMQESIWAIWTYSIPRRKIFRCLM